MIAAKDPQEFIPSGRQQILRHPGIIESQSSQNNAIHISHDFLLNRFESVSLSESRQTEWWLVRKSPNYKHKTHPTNKEKKGSYLNTDLENQLKSSNAELLENSWSYRSSELLYNFNRLNKRLSDIQGSKRRSLTDNDILNESYKTGSTIFSIKNNLDCKNVEVMEEELYVNDKTVIWSKGLTSTGNSLQFDGRRVTLCSYTSRYPIKHALWCTFYSELPVYNNANIANQNINIDEPRGKPLPSICIVDNQNMHVFTVDSEDFVTTIPFQISGIWTTKFGVLLEKEKSSQKNCKLGEEDAVQPTMFFMTHPIDEVCPVAIRQGSVKLIDDYSIKIVFTSENPSICMTFDAHSGQHSLYFIRKIKSEEWLEISHKLISPAPSMYNLSNRLKNRLSIWDTRGTTPIPGPSRPPSVNLNIAASHSQQQSRSHSPMATISRCQSPIVSPLVGNSPWFPRSNRLHNSWRASTNTSLAMSNTHLEVAQDYHHVNPILCLDHLWTDTYSSQVEGANNYPASKVFLSEDLVGNSYLCYLIPSRSQLSIVHIRNSNSNSLTFGMVTSISAQDAVSITHLHMIAILEYSGSIVLYSGLTIVGKLHVGGVLAQHAPSPCVMRRSLQQYTSPFPRRSTLLPHYGTPITPDSLFDEHFLSPVLPISNFSQRRTSGFYKINDIGKTQLNGLRDAIGDRLTLQYSDGTYYRIALPTLASTTLVEKCLNALRQTLQKDCSITLLTRWYAARNSPGSNNLHLEEEWHIFVNLIYELLGFDIYSSNDLAGEPPMTPSNAAKRQRPSLLGTSIDWNNLMESDHHKQNYNILSEFLHLQGALFKHNSQSLPSTIQINAKSVLFPYIRIIHYTLHLLYEELKLNIMHSGDLPLLARFLSKLSHDLFLTEYVVHYWKDFPEICGLQRDRNVIIPENAMKNIIQWPIIKNNPESIMKHLFCLLNETDVSPFPYINNVNLRSKAVVQLCGMYVKGSRNPNSEICIDKLIIQVSSACKLERFSTPKSKVISATNISEKIAILMTNMGITSRDLDSYPTAINLLLYNALWQCRENPPTNWANNAYNLLQRYDLAAHSELLKKGKNEVPSKSNVPAYETGSVYDMLPSIKQIDDIEHEDGMGDVESSLLKLRFPDDHRVTETRRLLQSSKPVTISLVQRPDVTDHDFIEEQEKHLYAICARTMALPVARGMFTLRTATPVVTEPLSLPKLCLTGKSSPRGVTVELSHIDYPQNMQHWPLFHNGVANGLRISPDAHNIDSTWIIFNKPKNNAETNMEHAGFLMALGLNKHLTNLTIISTYKYLSKANEMTSIGILLGLSSAMRGTLNTVMTKLLSVHLEALLPPTSMELDIPHNLQVAALLGVGLTYQGSAHRHITEVLLSEIGRPPGPEMENSTDRESYSLAAGLALGLVTLCQGGKPSGLSDLNVPDTLHYYMVGGNKRPLEGSQKDKYKVPSFQIREGSTVNLDVTAPGATIALGLMYLKSGNKALADWMTPPGTQYLLDFIRPDFLMLRVLSRGLILWDDIQPQRNWIENQVPETIRPFCMVKPGPSSSDIDYETMNQAYCNIVAGACFVMGLKYAGSTNPEAFSALLYYCHMFTSLTGKSIAELAGKPTIETCLNVVLLSASMVMAGTGNLEIIRIVRHLRRRVGLSSSAVVTYGSHLAIHMALGLLFLGGGRYTLSNSPESIAALICAFYPKFPTHSSDNRYHLQAFRHLYVLAVEPRLIIPQDVVTGRMCYANLKIVYLNGDEAYLRGPCLIPDLNTLAKLYVKDERYWCVGFERQRNWNQLTQILNSSGFIEVKQRAGCLSYLEDKFGFRTQLARTLTHSKIMPWNPPASVITSFSSDAAVRNFTEIFLTPEIVAGSSPFETKLVKLLTKVTYECVIKDKEIVLTNIIHLTKIVQDLNNKSSDTLQIWQLKLALVQVLKNIFPTHLVSSEMILALKQEVNDTMECWETDIKIYLTNFLHGKNLNCSNDLVKQIAKYVIFYDIPYGIRELFTHKDYINIVFNLSSEKYLPETIFKILTIFGISISSQN